MKNYNQLILNNSDGCHYKLQAREIDHNNITLTLFYSIFGEWSSKFRGKRTTSLKDSGSDVNIIIHKKTLPVLDYCEVQELLIILQAYSRHQRCNRDNLKFLKKREHT